MPENTDNSAEKHIKKQLPAGMKPWKPGESGNPAGRPKKGTALTDVMREYLEGTIEGKGITRKEALVKAVFARAMKGGDAAQKLIMSYIDGYPVQPIEGTFDGEIVINFGDAD